MLFIRHYSYKVYPDIFNILLDMELGIAHNFCHDHSKSSAINCKRSDNLCPFVISNSMVHAARNARLLGDDRMSINSQEWESIQTGWILIRTEFCIGALVNVGNWMIDLLL